MTALIKKGGITALLKYGVPGGIVKVEFDPEVVITQQMGVDQATEVDLQEFSWTLKNVGSHGTFRDGSPWVVPKNGSSVTLVGATPSSQQATVTIPNENNVPTEFTFRYNGVVVNPTPSGNKYSLQEMADARYLEQSNGGNGPGKWRLADNRVANGEVLGQSDLDEFFDVDTFNSNMSALTSGGGGITLQTNDVCVLTASSFDETNTEKYSGFDRNFGCRGFVYDSETRYNAQSAIKWQAALYVLSEAPVSPSTTFRPPVMWEKFDGSGNRLARPILTESDIVDFSVLSTTDSVANPPSPSFGYQSSLDFADVHRASGPILADCSGTQYESQIACFNVFLGNNKSYGGDFATIMTAMFSSAFKNNQTEYLHDYLQIALDLLGSGTCMTRLASGAGQKAGYTLPAMLAACRFFEPLNQYYGVENLTGFLVDGDYSALTNREKQNVKSVLFFEENTAWAIAADDSERPDGVTPTSDATQWGNTITNSEIGDTYRGTIAPASITSGLAKGLKITTTLDEGSGNGAVVETDVSSTTTVLEISNPENQDGNYIYRTSDGTTLASSANGFGYIKTDAPVSGLFLNAENYNYSHSAGSINLLGCFLKVDSSYYTIVGVSENIVASESGYVDSQYPIYVFVDSAFSSDPSLATSVEIVPFDDSAAVGEYVYLRGARRITGASQDYPPASEDPTQTWTTRSIHNDGYAKFLFRSVVSVFSALRILDGDPSSLGKAGAFLDSTYWDSTSDRNAFFGNVAGDRTMHDFAAGPAKSSGEWIRAIVEGKGQTFLETKTFNGQQV